jgi:hypothetical protein
MRNQQIPHYESLPPEPIPLVLPAGDPPQAVPLENQCPSRNYWIAVSVKQSPGDIVVYFSHSHGTGGDVGPAGIGLEYECSYEAGLSGLNSECQRNSSVEVGAGPVAGVETSTTNAGQPDTVIYAGMDLKIGQGRVGVGNSGFEGEASIGSSAPPGMPTHGAAVGIRIRPRSTPNTPYTHLTGVTLNDVVNNGGLEAWVAIASGRLVDEFIDTGNTIPELQGKLNFLYQACYSLDTYEGRNGTIRNIVYNPNQRFCGPH